MLFWGLLIACVIWTGICLWFYLEKYEKCGLLSKALATFGPTLVAVVGIFLRGNLSDWLLLLSALFFIAADVVLERNMLIGVLLFLTGHLGMASAIIIRGCSWVVIGIAAVLGVLTVVCVYGKGLKKFGALLPALLVYVAVLFGMVGAAMSGLWQSEGFNTIAILTAAGAISFAISDMMLGEALLNGYRSHAVKWWIMILYEAGVLLLTLAPFAGNSQM